MVEINVLKLVQDSYVGGSQSDVDCIMGTLDVKSGQFTGTMPQFFSNVGLSLNTLVQCRFTDVEANAELSGWAFGYLWDPSTDIMGVKLKCNPLKNARY